MGYFETLMVGRKETTLSEATEKKTPVWVLVLEILVVTFLFSIIPALIQLGRPPESLTEIYTDILTAILMALYAYMRIRNIAIPEKPPE